MSRIVARAAIFAAFAAIGCGGLPVVGVTPTVDAATVDAPTVDAATVDAPTVDAATVDAPTVDAATVDAPTVSADAGPSASAAPDAGLAAGDPLVSLQVLATPIESAEVRVGSDGMLYVCGGRDGLHRIDASDPTAMVDLGSSLLTVGGETLGFCSHLAPGSDAVYLGVRGDPHHGVGSIIAMDFSTGAPVVVGEYEPVGLSVEGLAASGRTVYAALHEDGLGVLERTDTGLELRGSLGGFTNAWGVAVAGTTVYVADDTGGLVVADVTDPTAPAILGRVPIDDGEAHAVAVDPARHLAYVAAGEAGLVIIDVSTPTAPLVVSRTGLPMAATDVAFSGNAVYVAAGMEFRQYDTTDPTQPAVTARRGPSSGFAFQGPYVPSVATRDNVVFAAEWRGLHSFMAMGPLVAPGIEVSGDALNFGRVAPGGSQSLHLTVSNIGRSPLEADAMAPTGIALTVSPSHVSLAPGATTDVTVTFAPSDASQMSANVLWSTNDPSSPVVTIPATGNLPFMQVGDLVPEMAIDMGTGTPWSLSAQRGHTVLIMDFTTWCPVNALAFSELETAVWQRFRDRGLVVVGADIGSILNIPDPPQTVQAFQQQTGATFPTGMYTDPALTTMLGLNAGMSWVAVAIVVNPTGHAVVLDGNVDTNALASTLDQILPP